jgi:TonB family protein
MNAPRDLQNLVFYCLQITFVGSAGLTLPRILRLQAPRVLYFYWQSVLVACLLLPFLQSRRPGMLGTGATVATRILSHSNDVATGLARHPAAPLILLLVVGGVVVRLMSLGLGLVKLRRYRAGAGRFESLPPAIQELAACLGVLPEFRLSKEVQSPVTFGICHAVVLLPPRFAQMDAGRQQAIASHELLHIARHDWAVNLAEEFVLAALWFHPVIWWLVERIRLGREQIVDQQVVRMTGDRMSYLHALVEIAAGPRAIHGLVAPALLKECQLAERIRTLTREDFMTKPRIVLTLASVVLFTLLAGVGVVRAFPLRAGSSPSNNPKDDQTAPVKVGDQGVTPPIVTYKPDPIYTKEARAAKIKGDVALRVVIAADGSVKEAKVQKSLDPGLDQNAVNAIMTWKFKPATKAGKPVPCKVTVEVSFRLR